VCLAALRLIERAAPSGSLDAESHVGNGFWSSLNRPISKEAETFEADIADHREDDESRY
jgi:hypothetical protein